MWIANDDQRAYMEGTASFLLQKLHEWRAHPKDTLVNFVFNDFCQMVRMGYMIAMGEVHSTPWEYMRSGLMKESMDAMSDAGWEPLLIAGQNTDWMIWRRRKAVSDGDSPTAD